MLKYFAFSYFEDLFARDAHQPTVVNVTAKAYRAVSPSAASLQNVDVLIYSQGRLK